MGRCVYLTPDQIPEDPGGLIRYPSEGFEIRDPRLVIAIGGGVSRAVSAVRPDVGLTRATTGGERNEMSPFPGDSDDDAWAAAVIHSGDLLVGDACGGDQLVFLGGVG